MIWQMMMAMLHSDEQQMTEKDGDADKGYLKPAVQQKTAADDDECVMGRGRLRKFLWVDCYTTCSGSVRS